MPARVALIVVLGAAAASTLGAQTRPPQGVAGSATVVGKVVDTHDRPIIHAQVDLTSDALPARTDGGYTSLSVLTNDDGEFVFTGLPAGFYHFRSSKHGYMSGFVEDETRALTYTGLQLAAGDRRVDLRIRMVQFAMVTGTITGAAGTPLRYASLAAYRRRVASGRLHYELETSAMTDDRGVYRLAGIEPGPYVFVASSGQVLTFAADDDSGAQRFMYSSVTQPSARTDGSIEPMVLAAGQVLTDLDFELAREPVVRVSGVVTGGAGFSTHLTLETADRQTSPLPVVRGGASLAQRDGHFVIDGVRPGRYVLRAIQRVEDSDRPSSPQSVIRMSSFESTMSVNLGGGQPSPPTPHFLFLAETAVTVGRAATDGLMLSLQPGPLLNGRIVFDGTTPVPSTGDRYGDVGIVLEPVDSRSPYLSLTRAIVGKDLRVVAGEIGYGRYVLRASEASSWLLRSAMAAGKDLSAEPFDVASTDLRDVVLTFTDRRPVIDGVVTGMARSQAPVWVVLFPVDPKRWADYGQDSERIVVVQAADDGRYMASPLPGEYYVLATSSELPDNWRLAENLQRLAALADRASVSEGEQLTINLRVRALGR